MIATTLNLVLTCGAGKEHSIVNDVARGLSHYLYIDNLWRDPFIEHWKKSADEDMTRGVIYHCGKRFISKSTSSVPPGKHSLLWLLWNSSCENSSMERRCPMPYQMSTYFPIKAPLLSDLRLTKTAQSMLSFRRDRRQQLQPIIQCQLMMLRTTSSSSESLTWTFGHCLADMLSACLFTITPFRQH